jgi:hypothetical protein
MLLLANIRDPLQSHRVAEHVHAGARVLLQRENKQMEADGTQQQCHLVTFSP